MNMQRASVGRRLAALTIDWSLAILTSALFLPPFASSLGPSALRLGVFVLEVSLLTALTGSSMGQKIVGLRVVSWPDQLFISPGRALTRTILIALVIPAVVYDSDGRGLHERLTQTTVVRINAA